MRRLPALILATTVAASTVSLAARAQDRDGRARDAKAPSGALVTLTADSEPLAVVLKRLCTSQGYNFVADDAALKRAGNVTLSLTDVTFDDALEAICDAYNLEGRVRGLDARPIVVIRARVEARPRAPLDEAIEPSPERAPERPAPRSGNRFIDGPAQGMTPRLERGGPAPAASQPIAPVTTHESPAQAPSVAPVSQGPRGIVVGLVVDIAADKITLKEATGDPREFWVPAADSDALRNERLTRGLAHLKKGDRVALEYRGENGHLVITNLVGGGKPPTETP